MYDESHAWMVVYQLLAVFLICLLIVLIAQ